VDGSVDYRGSRSFQASGKVLRTPHDRCRAYRDRARLTREGIEIDRRIHDALIKLAEGRQ